MPGFESFTPLTWLWIAAVIAFAGVVHGTLGLGFPTVATPLLALAMDMRSAVILVLIPCIAVTWASILKGPSLKPVLARFWFMPLAMIAGAAAGTRLFVAAPGWPYALLLAGMILVYLNLDRMGLAQWPAAQRNEAAFGVGFAFLAGVFEGTANVAAPPLIVYYMAIGLPVTSLVQGLNICFVVGKTTQFGVMAATGGVLAAQWLVTLPLAVLGTATLLAGIRIRDRVDAVTYRGWLKKFLFAMALVLLAQYGWASLVR